MKKGKATYIVRFYCNNEKLNNLILTTQTFYTKEEAESLLNSKEKQQELYQKNRKIKDLLNRGVITTEDINMKMWEGRSLPADF